LSGWRDDKLHAWLTIASLYGRIPPLELDDSSPDLPDDERRGFIHRAISVEENGAREIADRRGLQIKLNSRFVDKLLPYTSRAPYAAWVAYGIENAVEIWQNAVNNETRNYYMVPVITKKMDGFVVIASDHDNTIFNVFPFVESYADAKLRDGRCIYKAYPADLICSTECCERIALDRRELRALRKQNRELQEKVKKLRFDTKAKEKRNAPK
jgi:hypothetical protein